MPSTCRRRRRYVVHGGLVAVMWMGVDWLMEGS